MIVVTLTDCPPRLRGDLTKWLAEVNTGVYVGNASARVRDELWDRICEHVKDGRATMVYSARNEQGMAFRVHNTTWEPVDFDGITLMRRPVHQLERTGHQAEKQSRANHPARHPRVEKWQMQDYSVIDLETTGLSPVDNQIVEIAALRVRQGQIVEELEQLVRIDQSIPTTIVEMTGITNEMLNSEGIDLHRALERLWHFVGNDPIVAHHASFDISFLRTACAKINVGLPRLRIVDTMDIARKHRRGLEDYKLITIAKALGIEVTTTHRAKADCLLAHQVYQKLNEKCNSDI